MRFMFLGTSAGAPSLHRNVTGLALAMDQSRSWYLFDCGEGSQQQLLRTPYSSAKLRTIFVSHVHGDHCYGLPGLIASANMSGRTEPMTICAPDGIEQYVRNTFAYTDVRHLRFELNFIRSDQQDFYFEDEAIAVTSIALSHRVPCFAYAVTEKPNYHLNIDKLLEAGVPKGPLWNDLQQGRDVCLDDGRKISAASFREPSAPARKMIIAGDNDQPELLAEAMAASDVLVHEATFTEDVLAHVGPQYMHSTAAMVADAAEQAKLPHLLLTHFSQRYRGDNSGKHSLADLREEAQQRYQGGLHMAEDFACYQLNRDKTLSLIS